MLDNMELARAKLALHSPEFISLLCRLECIPSDRVPTAGTDGRRLWYNRDWIATLTLRQTIGLVIHEVGHNMLAHPARVGMRDPEIANIAMDIVLNQMLKQYFEETKDTLHAEFPPGDLVPGSPVYQKNNFAQYDGWNFEKVYGHLCESGKNKGCSQFDYVEGGKHEDGTPMTAAEQDALAKEWTMAAQQAANTAKQRGLNSGFFESFVAGLVKTRVDWRSQLWDICTRITKNDQSFRKFNRKFISSDIYLPGLYSEEMGSVGFFTDTSGSMHDDNFKIALGAMNELMEQLRPERIVFGCCDTQMNSVEELTADDLPIMQASFKGRGGTVLTPIFKYIKGMSGDPLELIVVLTDGEHDVISKDLEPGCPVVWLVTTSSVEAAQSSFGKVIRVDGE